jgi:hypothetical protein
MLPKGIFQTSRRLMVLAMAVLTGVDVEEAAMVQTPGHV